MRLDQLDGYSEAQQAIQANISPRARHLANLEAYVDGTQYEGRPDWFSGDCPLWDRAPCVVYPSVRLAIDSNTDLLLGEGRFPVSTCRPEEDESESSDEGGLSLDEGEAIDRLIVELQKLSRFRAACREVLCAAQGCGTAVGIFGYRSGRPIVDTTRARWCEPEIDADGNCTRLVIQYPYLEQYREHGKWKIRSRLYRRVIDDRSDVTFLPADAREDGREPSWRRDDSKSTDHRLGFCPVVWYQFMRGCSVVGNIDGHAIHENLLDEIRALDFALSQRHRAALYAGDPQWVEIGVELGHNPSPGGRAAGMPATASGGPATKDNPVNGRWVMAAPRQARRKSPGDVWQYESPESKVELVTLPGDALKAIDEHAIDLKNKIQDSMAVVLLDPNNLKFATTTSGKALEALKQRQLDRCDQYRDDFGEGFIVPATLTILRITSALAARGELIQVMGLKKAMPALKKLVSDVLAPA